MADSTRLANTRTTYSTHKREISPVKNIEASTRTKRFRLINAKNFRDFARNYSKRTRKRENFRASPRNYSKSTRKREISPVKTREFVRRELDSKREETTKQEKGTSLASPSKGTFEGKERVVSPGPSNSNPCSLQRYLLKVDGLPLLGPSH